MKKWVWVIPLLAVTLLLCGATIWFIPNSYRQLFPQLDTYPDTYTVMQKVRPQMALQKCRVSLIHQQRLLTTETRNTIWSRLPKEWADGKASYSSYNDQTHYLRNIADIWIIRSWIHYDSAISYETPVYITNSVVIQFCN